MCIIYVTYIFSICICLYLKQKIEIYIYVYICIYKDIFYRGEIHIAKLTILTCTVQWHLAHSQCRATTTSNSPSPLAVTLNLSSPSP